MRDDKFVTQVIIGIVGCLTVILGILLYIFYTNSESLKSKHANNNLTPKTIKIWTIHGGIENILKEVATDYQNEHEDIEIEISTFKNEIYQTTVQNAVMTNEMPDIFFFWGYEKLKKLIDLGVVWELNEMLATMYDGEIPIQESMRGLMYDEKIYGMPLYGWNASLFCNTTLFETHQIDYPTTYESFLATIDAFKEKGITPLANGSKEMWMHSLYYMYFVLSEGDVSGVYAARENQEAFQTEQFYRAAQKLIGLNKRNPWGDKYVESDAYDAAYFFSQGEAAMLLSGSWVAANIDSEGSKVTDQVRVIPFPGVKDDIGIGGYVDTFVVNKQSKITVDEDLKRAYLYIVKEVGRKAVEEYGIGLPAYEQYQLEKEEFPTLYQCAQEASGKRMHPAYDQIFDNDFSNSYYGLLYEVSHNFLSAEAFVNQLGKK